MSGHVKHEAKTALGRVVNGIEETAIAIILGLMAVITFINVVLRYGFNSSLIWGLEVTLILFAWLVLFGIAYGFKVTAHLGVDALTNLFPPAGRKFLALVAAACCIAYAFLLLKGAWDYWAPFAALQPTEGRWFPLGFTEGVRDRAFYITDQVPMLGAFRWLEDAINYGEEYEKLPRVIPYAILPFACALILFRVLEATWELFTGDRESLIVSHEAEDAVEEAAAKHGQGG
ncbi:MAG: TRAP transporter small permease [Rhodobacter sp.]|nr:TRAP transporter small permease [Rhodobacter sp.]